MFSSKKLAIAAMTALSLGVGSAMAQEGPTVGAPNDRASPPLFHNQATTSAHTAGLARTTMPQAGGSDPIVGQFGLLDGVSSGGG